MAPLRITEADIAARAEQMGMDAPLTDRQRADVKRAIASDRLGKKAQAAKPPPPQYITVTTELTLDDGTSVGITSQRVALPTTARSPQPQTQKGKT